MKTGASLFLLLCLLCPLCVLCRADCGDQPTWAQYDPYHDFDECINDVAENNLLCLLHDCACVCDSIIEHNSKAYGLVWADWENCRMGA